MAAIALSIGIAVGWWSRGIHSGNTPAPSHGVTSTTQAPYESLETTNDALRLQSISAHGPDRGDHDRDIERIEGPQPVAQRAPHDVIADASAYELFIEADETDPWVEEIEEVDAQQRALDRREDFLAFGDGPVTRDRSVQVALSARNAQAQCLPLGASGCRRDLDCCGAHVCRSRAGQIAGFMECTEVR
ncbi:MAG: hypothetical protein GY946_07105 [bacterium]|nr:hypothetical protein [bacterium]